MIIRIIKLVISLIFLNVDYLKKLIDGIAGKKSPGICVVLYYHTVPPTQKDKFARQMDDVIKWAKPISIENLEKFEAGILHVGITFDDAFVSVIENALPELVKRKIPFTIFVPSGCLGQQPKWIKSKKNQDYQDIVMSVDQLKKIKDNNLISFGSHCITHSNLLSLNEIQAKNEIIQSKCDLENMLQKKIKTMSFPYGAFNEACIEWAREAGYDRVFTILPTLAFSNFKEYVTGRVKVDPTDWHLEFQLKLFGAYRWLPLAYALKKKIRSVVSN